MEFSNSKNERANPNIKLIEEELRKPEIFQKLSNYLNETKFLAILEKLGIEANFDAIKDYIIETLNGKFKGIIAVNQFFNNIEEYINNDELKRVENGFVDFKYMLPISEKPKKRRQPPKIRKVFRTGWIRIYS